MLLARQFVYKKSLQLPLFQLRYVTKVVKVPTMADSISEGEISRWEKKVGEFVKQDEHVATVETDKIDVQINSPESGVILKVFANEGDSIQVGQDFFEIDLDGKPSEESSPPSSKEKATETVAPKSAKPSSPKPTPPSTPPPPKIQSPKQAPKTLNTAAGNKESKPAAENLKSVTPSSPVDFGDSVPGLAPLSAAFRGEKRVKMNRMRQRIAERLKESQDVAASLTTFNEIDMSSLVDFRNKYKDEVFKSHDVKLGFMSAFIKASTVALKEIPAVNASIDSSGEDPEIVYNDFCDVSIAVATPKGLVTPVLRNVEQLNFVEIERAVAAFGAKARDGKISIEDMAGGTFTISNGGVFGSLYGTPIINVPQSAILGMHAIKDRPIAVNGKVEIRPMMYVALTYDHRLIDGREAVTFLKTIKDCIEDPRKILLF